MPCYRWISLETTFFVFSRNTGENEVDVFQSVESQNSWSQWLSLADFWGSPGTPTWLNSCFPFCPASGTPCSLRLLSLGAELPGESQMGSTVILPGLWALGYRNKKKESLFKQMSKRCETPHVHFVLLIKSYISGRKSECLISDLTIRGAWFWTISQVHSVASVAQCPMSFFCLEAACGWRDVLLPLIFSH